MPRTLALLLLLTAGALFAQKQQPKPEEPPEEDVTVAKTAKEYAFNPLQAEKELRVGNYYYKKGSFKAAASRFDEATKWNPGLAEAWFRLGEAREKLKDNKAARQAFAKFVEISPDDKRAPEIRKKIGEKP